MSPDSAFCPQCKHKDGSKISKSNETISKSGSQSKNPSLQPSWLGGMVYWECPRCYSQDVYKSRQVTRSFGMVKDLENSDNFIGMKAPIYEDLWTCRECGELAVKISRPHTKEEKAKQRKIDSELSESNFYLKFAAIMLIPITMIILLVWSFF